MATDSSDLKGLWRKLRYLSTTMDEIDGWSPADRRSRSGLDVPNLLGSLLAKKRVTLQSIEEHLARDQDPGRDGSRSAV